MSCRLGLWGGLSNEQGRSLLQALEPLLQFEVYALREGEEAPDFADDEEEHEQEGVWFRRQSLPSAALDLEDIDILVLLAPWPQGAASLMQHPALQVVDLSAQDSVALNALQLARWHTLPSPALDLSLRVLHALRSLGLQQVCLSSMEPVSMLSLTAPQYLVKETVDLLSGRGLPEDAYAQQLAFNVSPIPAQQQQDLRQGILRHLDAGAIDVQVLRVQVPVFYGLWQAFSLHFKRPWGLDAIVESLRLVDFQVSESAAATTPAQLLAHSEATPALICHVQEGHDASHWQLYAGVDNLRFSVVKNLCELLQNLEKLL